MEQIKFLADANVEKEIVKRLIFLGFDVKWTPDYDVSMSDEELLYLAKAEKRVLITNDKDFGILAFLKKQFFCGVVLIRIKENNVGEKVRRIKSLVKNHKGKILNHFIVVTTSKIRFIPMEEIQ